MNEADSAYSEASPAAPPLEEDTGEPEEVTLQKFVLAPTLTRIITIVEHHTAYDTRQETINCILYSYLAMGCGRSSVPVEATMFVTRVILMVQLQVVRQTMKSQTGLNLLV